MINGIEGKPPNYKSYKLKNTKSYYKNLERLKEKLKSKQKHLLNVKFIILLMVKKVNELLLKDNILEFETCFNNYNEKKSYALILVPYKQTKALGWTKETKLHIIINEVKE